VINILKVSAVVVTGFFIVTIGGCAAAGLAWIVVKGVAF